MCTTKAKEFTVDQPLTVYKIVMRKVNPDKDGPLYLTPFQRVPVSKLVMEGRAAHLPSCSYKGLEYDPSYLSYVAAKGFVHAYKTLEDAALDISYYLGTGLILTPGYAPELWECEVPVPNAEEKTDYCYEGHFDGQSDTHCIAAKRMVFKRKVEYSAISDIRAGRRVCYDTVSEILDKIETAKHRK